MSNDIKKDIENLLNAYKNNLKSKVKQYCEEIIEENEYLKQKINDLTLANERLRSQNVDMHYKLKAYRNRAEKRNDN